MNTSPSAPATRNEPNLAAGVARRVAQVAVVFIVEAALMFAGAGRPDWLWAWVYVGITLALVLGNGIVLLRTSAELVAERGNPKEMRKWDKVVSLLWLFLSYLALPLQAGLDARFGWTPALGVIWNVAGVAILILAYELTIWAMLANAYFSTTVRIQSERGHTVCNTGPYRYVRHPGYVGFMLMSLGTALLLGSWWAVVPALAAAIPMVIRTAFEDRMLQAELPGYREYAQETRYRLLPGIW
jgi:protein-S-isoprenylcysteine O-methyltransferase Ste14